MQQSLTANTYTPSPMPHAYQIHDQSSVYFLTFQVVGWADVFSRQSYRDILIDSMEHCCKKQSLTVYAYVIMTNHVHVIWQSKANSLSATVRDFKKFTARKVLDEILNGGRESRREWLELVFRFHAKHNKRAGDLQFWTHENHAIEVTDPFMLDQRIDYIHENPVRAGWVQKPEDYIYSSATNYVFGEGLVEVECTAM